MCERRGWRAHEPGQRLTVPQGVGKRREPEHTNMYLQEATLYTTGAEERDKHHRREVI